MSAEITLPWTSSETTALPREKAEGAAIAPMSGTRGFDWSEPLPWAVTFAAWTVVGLLSIAQSLALQSPISATVARRIILTPLLGVWVWSLYTPLILEAAMRLRLTRRYWPKTVTLHVIGILATCVLDVIFDRYLGDALTGRPSRSALRDFEAKLFIDSFSYAALVAVGQAIRYARLYRERLAHESALRQQLLSAENTLLRMQLNPHFLFNTLNSVAELIHHDPDGADEMVTRLGALLRLSFGTLRESTVSLGEELDFVEQYLGIMQVRLRGRLSVSVSASAEARDAQIPPLLLQPLVENALRHGIERRPGSGRLEIEARCAPFFGEDLVIEVRDDGAGLTGDPFEAPGIGLRNTRARLRQLYGEKGVMVVRPRCPAGVIVAVHLPYVASPARAQPMDWISPSRRPAAPADLVFVSQGAS
ncbi:MAG TPA: histidine kinase [Gemmatimonadaceae bacterium]